MLRKQAIATLPVRYFCAQDALYCRSCCVCLDELLGNRVMTLPCFHQLHESCGYEWFILVRCKISVRRTTAICGVFWSVWVVKHEIIIFHITRATATPTTICDTFSDATTTTISNTITTITTAITTTAAGSGDGGSGGGGGPVTTASITTTTTLTSYGTSSNQCTRVLQIDESIHMTEASTFLDGSDWYIICHQRIVSRLHVEHENCS